MKYLYDYENDLAMVALSGLNKILEKFFERSEGFGKFGND